MGQHHSKAPRPTTAGYLAIGTWLQQHQDIAANQYVTTFVKAISDHVGFEVSEASVRHVMQSMGIKSCRDRQIEAKKDEPKKDNAGMVDLAKRVARIERILGEIAPAHMMTTGGLFRHV